MAVTKNPARQEAVHAYVDIAYGDLTSGTDHAAIEVPANAVVVEGAVVVSTAWNSATSDVLDVGDSGSQNRYKNDINIAATGLTAITPTGYKYTTKDNITVRWVGVSTAPTTGALRLRVSYIVIGKSEFTQGMVLRSDGTSA